MNYYKPILAELLAKNAIPCLVDLGGWASFSDGAGCNRYHNSADNLDSDILYVLKTSEFFLKLANVEEGPVFNLLEEISERVTLLAISQNYPNSGRTIAEAIGNCPVLNKFNTEDCLTTKPNGDRS